VPEDRQTTGLVLDYPVATNLILRDFEQPPCSRRGLMDFAYIRRHAADLVKRYDVRLRTIQQPARFLSGGNQQKLILAREIEANPQILVVMQACKGLDVGAIEFVQNTILDLKTKGVAVLYISTELEHVLAISDRIAVMYRGRVTGLLEPEEATPGRLGELMAGVPAEAA
jgi:general nucleoside transport system ATP-binding protein